MKKSVLVDKILKTKDNLGDPFLKHPGKIYTFLNPVSYLDAIEHKNLFQQFDGIFADGSLLVAAIRIIYGVRVARRSFDMTSVAPELFDYAQKTGKSVYIVASKQEQVEIAVSVFCNRYPGLKIIGCRNGYFNSEEEQVTETKHIVEINPDFLIVGMGVIMQEKFLLRVKKAGFKGIGFTCGGFIHQTASNMIDYYPAWIDRMNLRFVYRFIHEPHTRMRYIKAGLVFPVRFIWERFFG